MRIVKLMICLAAMGMSAHAADQVSTTCRRWKTFSQPEKLTWTLGAYEGLGLGGFDAAKPEEDFKAFVRTYFAGTFQDTADGLTQFCADPANVNVFAKFALQVVAMRLRGASPDEVEKLAATLRKLAAIEGAK